MSHEATVATLQAAWGAASFSTYEFRDSFRITVPVERVSDILKCLKEQCGFDMLADLTAVDYLHYANAKDRYGVIYCLSNTASGERIVVRTFVNDPDPTVQSCFALWKGADWMEREVFDM